MAENPVPAADYVRALILGAEGREEYAERSSNEEHRQFLLGEAAAFRSAARLLESSNVNEFLASALPSWRWPSKVDAYVTRDNPHHFAKRLVRPHRSTQSDGAE